MSSLRGETGAETRARVPCAAPAPVDCGSAPMLRNHRLAMSHDRARSGQSIAAISLDLDDTLWPVLPTLLAAEQALGDWLSSHAPATAAWLTTDRRTSLRASILANHPDRGWDMSWLRHRLLCDALTQAGDDPALADAAFEVFLAARQQVRLYDDVRPQLEAWQTRYPLIAISNGNADLDRIGLGDLFTVKISAHQVGFAKPDARIFQLACEQAACRPEQVFHIGDDLELDFLAARRAGLQAGWIRRADLGAPGRRKGRAMPPAVDPHTGADVPGFATLHELDAHLAALAARAGNS